MAKYEFSNDHRISKVTNSFWDSNAKFKDYTLPSRPKMKKFSSSILSKDSLMKVEKTIRRNKDEDDNVNRMIQKIEFCKRALRRWKTAPVVEDDSENISETIESTDSIVFTSDKEIDSKPQIETKLPPKRQTKHTGKNVKTCKNALLATPIIKELQPKIERKNVNNLSLAYKNASEPNSFGLIESKLTSGRSKKVVERIAKTDESVSKSKLTGQFEKPKHQKTAIEGTGDTKKNSTKRHRSKKLMDKTQREQILVIKDLIDLLTKNQEEDKSVTTFSTNFEEESQSPKIKIRGKGYCIEKFLENLKDKPVSTRLQVYKSKEFMDLLDSMYDNCSEAKSYSTRLHRKNKSVGDYSRHKFRMEKFLQPELSKPHILKKSKNKKKSIVKPLFERSLSNLSSNSVDFEFLRTEYATKHASKSSSLIEECPSVDYRSVSFNEKTKECEESLVLKSGRTFDNGSKHESITYYPDEAGYSSRIEECPHCKYGTPIPFQVEINVKSATSNKKPKNRKTKQLTISKRTSYISSSNRLHERIEQK